MKNSSVLSAAMLLAAMNAVASAPKPAPHWVGTWACAPVRELIERAPKAAKEKGIETLKDTDSTVRDVVHVSIGGKVIRLRISNEFGTSPLKIAGVHVALSGIVNPPGGEEPAAHGAANPKQMATGADTTKPGTDHAATFNGAADVTIPAGKFVYTDAIAMDVPALSSLAVSIFVLKQPGNPLTLHAVANSTNFYVEGDQMAATSLPTAKKIKSWVFLTGVDVDAAPAGRAVVMMGDSITDGNISTLDANRRWPDDLARRLQADPKTKDVGVLNAAIAGGRILFPQAGESMTVRFDRDVLGQAGVKYVIIYGGLNDINHSQNRPDPAQPEGADELIRGLKQMIDKAHAKGIKVFGSPMTPEGGSTHATPAGEAIREKVNTWIRTSGAYDAVFDFDKAVRDPAHPDTLLPAYGGEKSGHIHMYDVGYQAVADSIDLSKFD